MGKIKNIENMKLNKILRLTLMKTIFLKRQILNFDKLIFESKGIYFTILFLIFASSNVQSQIVNRNQNACVLNNYTKDLTDKGFIALNDSIILVNYNDSCLALNLSTCKIINKFKYSITPNYDYFGIGYTEIPTWTENGVVYFRAKFNNENWFCSITQDLNIKKIFRIETDNFIFKKYNGKFYALVQSGKFFNAGSTVGTDFSSGIIVFTPNGFLMDFLKIRGLYDQNGGLNNESEIIITSFLIKDGYFYLPIGNQYKALIGSTIYNYSINGYKGIPNVVLMIDTLMKFKKSFLIGCNQNGNQSMINLILNQDSINVQGLNYPNEIVYLPGMGQITSSVNGVFHYNFNLSLDLEFGYKVCTYTGSKGCNRFANISETGISYVPYYGTIFAGKPYSAGGGENFIVGGHFNAATCEANKCTNFVSQEGIFGKIAQSPNFKILAVDNSADFFAGDNRYTGKGVYYFAINQDGLASLDSLHKFSGNIGATYNLENSKSLIFPNPVSDNFWVEIGNDLNSPNNNISIENSFGQVICNFEINQSRTIINLQNKLSPGIYFISICNFQNTKIISKKLIIN